MADEDNSKAWEEVGAEDPIEQFSDEDLLGLQGGRLEEEEEEDEEPSLGPEATVRQIRARLSGLGWSTHGTKANLLNKLKAAEKEHKKMKPRQRAIEEERLGRHSDEMKNPKSSTSLESLQSQRWQGITLPTCQWQIGVSIASKGKERTKTIDDLKDKREK